MCYHPEFEHDTILASHLNRLRLLVPTSLYGIFGLNHSGVKVVILFLSGHNIVFVLIFFVLGLDVAFCEAV